ncbi:MAG: class I SAM-dependent rRNA methyltransferase [Bacteroidales bacterium]|nr:class I SAM-dependent rRNA methyltransferase [Bacteroidales bacterium]
MKKITLQRGKEKSLLRYHPWVFSGAIARKDKDIAEGDIVEVYSFDNQYLATGHYHDSSTCVKVFSFEQVEPDELFWTEKLANAFEYRRSLGLTDSFETNAFRLVNGEGDYLPGLIIDWYNGHVVLQFHSYGMYRLRETFVKALLNIFGNRVKSIYDKSSATLPETAGFQPIDQLLYGSFDEVLVRENGVPFYIDIINGQKTGFFLDQRENRHLVGQYAAGNDVLNLFCYSGGFSAYALMGGARRVDSVDISKKAIELTEKNIAELGASYVEKHNAFAENVFDFLEMMSPDYGYEVVILDPPAFAKHHKVKDQGIKGYRNLNRLAMRKVAKGGFLFTFSCSQAISKDDFQTIVFSAAAIEGIPFRVVRHLEAGADHPVDIFHPEGSYLKGMLLQLAE